jgi:DivIVA domain-containing protein
VLTPEDITARSFLVSLRGYDRDEVHAFLAQVADQLRDLQERIDELEEALTTPAPASAPDPAPVAAPAAAPAAPTSTTDLFAQIGQETQRILEAAQTAGDELRRKAEADAEAELREAHAEAERELEAARAEAERERTTARAEADRELKTARAESTKVIAEGERRREATEAVVAALTERRDALAATLRTLGKTVEQTLRELVPDAEPTATLREAVTAEADREAASTLDVPPTAAEPVVVAHEPDEVPDDGAATDDAAPDAETNGAATDAAATDAAATDGAEDDAEVEAPDVAETAELDPAAVAAATAPMRAAEASAAPDVEAEDAADDADDAATPEAAEPTLDPAADADDATAAVEDERDVAAVEVMDDDALSSSDLDPGLLEQAQALRAQALAPLHPKLVRKLKRGLQDVQNGLLDRIRRAEAKGTVTDFVPDAEALGALDDLAEEFLVTAWWGGTASGELLAGEEVDAPEPDRDLAPDLTAALTDQLLTALEAALAEGLAAGEDVIGIGERVGRVFSDLKEEPVEELSALALLRTYEEGLAAAWQVGGPTHRHWALAAEPACTDARCAANNRSGPAPLGAPFPSGHDAPPVRVGCNCTTVPLIPTSEPVS